MPLSVVAQSKMPQSSDLVPISEVERQVGIPQATLRVWERRYGFPKPLRDTHGDRVYPAHQVERLRQVRRLLDQGMRPSKVLSGDLDQELGTLPSAPKTGDPEGTLFADFASEIQMLRRFDAQEFRRRLQFQLVERGLSDFVIEVLAPLAQTVGLAWQYGLLPVRCEHFFSEQINAVLQTAIAALPMSEGRPRVLLTTLNYEPHALGILMAQALLSARQAHCINLGAGLPVPEVAQAAAEMQADIVALSFSASFPRRHLLQTLAQLHTALPKEVELWAGGQGVAHLSRAPTGIVLFDSLTLIEERMMQWRRREGCA